MKNAYNIRSLAASAINQVLEQGASLSTVLPELQRNITSKDQALLQELCFGCLRTLPQLEWHLQQLMAKPLAGKQKLLHYLLLVGIYQLLYTRIPAYAILAETVQGAVALKRPQLKGLINGVLRQFQRQQNELAQRATNNESHYLHPKWLINRLRCAYPLQWEKIIEANNQKPPMWLRVNRLKKSREEYMALLSQAGLEACAHPTCHDAIHLLTPRNVQELPGFAEGWVTVQDVSAQECIELLSPQDGETILDLCAAPGGKTTHILEAAPKAHVLAVDIDKERLLRIKENLKRLNLHAEVKLGDGKDPSSWCGNHQFDRILLDAPCSATGVIRRHPDIKWLRRDSDIDELVRLQSAILSAIWPHLKRNGTLLYATCSVLPQENSEQIAHFLKHHQDAKLVTTGDSLHPGKQKIPDPNDGDGFFYAKLLKI